MKKRISIFLIFVSIAACKKETKEPVKTSEKKETSYQPYGEAVSEREAITTSELAQQYKNLKIGDTLSVKFTGAIEKVCQKKGCWMTFPLNETQTVMVRFKDYGFFVPKDAAGRQVVIEGKAFVKETPVDELRHYAQDAGKTEAEIAAITEPKIEPAFEASGVLIAQ